MPLLFAVLLPFMAAFGMQAWVSWSLSTRHQIERMDSFLESANSISQLVSDQKNVALILGQSEIEVGFDPRKFDDTLSEAGIELATYNVATRFNAPENYLFLAKILRIKLPPGKKLKFIFYNLPTFATTAAYERTQKTGLQGAILFWRVMEAMGPRGILLLPEFLRILVPSFEIAPSFAASYRAVLSLIGSNNRAQEEGHLRVYHDLWGSQQFSDSTPWALERRGQYRFNIDSSQYSEISAQLMTPSSEASLVDLYESCCNISTLHPSANRISILEKVAMELSEIAEQVIFLNIPEAPFLDQDRSPQRRQNLQSLTTKLEAAGAQVWSAQTAAGLQRSDYFDPFHFNELGAEKIYKWLKARIATAPVSSN